MAANRDTFRALIREGQEEIRNVNLYERPTEFEDVGRYVLVGVRQAGKSYMLYKRAKQLIAEGHSVEEIVYIDFDDERLLGMSAEDFDLILQSYSSVYSHKPILFFDEIQNVAGWEHFARRLANQKYQVFITGSNAKMLSRDIRTTLGGRYMEGEIFPYSFSEYLGSQNIELEKEWQYSPTRSSVQLLFSQYFYWGGFPELLLYRNKRHWLNELYEKILLGDIILRNGIKNELAIRLLLKRLAESIGQSVSYNRLSNLIKGTGVNISTTSVIDYIRYAKDACIIFSIENYASKFVEKETIKKYYFIDNGLLNIFLLKGETELLENLCAIYLYQKYGKNLYFYNKGIEVDFVVPSEAMAIQVSYSISDPLTKEREINALKKFSQHEPIRQMTIVTFDEEETIDIEGDRQIRVVPVWKWLLERQ